MYSFNSPVRKCIVLTVFPVLEWLPMVHRTWALCSPLVSRHASQLPLSYCPWQKHHIWLSHLKYDSLNADVIENMGYLYPIKRLYSKFPFNSAIWNSGAVFYGSRTVDCSSFFQAGHKKGNLSIKYLFITVSSFSIVSLFWNRCAQNHICSRFEGPRLSFCHQSVL